MRILLVEDSEDDARLLLRTLRRGGYEPVYRQVDTPAAMEEALGAEAWDVVISDYSMPAFSGLAALALLRGRGLDTPFIVVSGAIGEEIAVEAMKAGAQDYVMKANLSRLVPAIQRELASHAIRAERTRAERTTARLRAIGRITEAGLARLPLSELISELLHRIRELLAADTATILLVNEAGTELVPYSSDDAVSPAIETAPISLGEGVVGNVAVTGAPAVVTDLSTTGGSDRSHIAPLKSLLAVPMLIQDSVKGVVCVATVERREFSEDDLHLLQVVADRATLAIENTRLYERMRFERALWQTTVESMRDPVHVVDAEGRVTFANPACNALLGCAVGHRCALEADCSRVRFRDGTGFDGSRMPVQRALRNEEVEGAELVTQLPSGEEIITVWNASPLRGQDGQILGAVAVGRDVTQQRKAEKERERLLAELQRANRKLRIASEQARASAEDARRWAIELDSVIEHVPARLALLDRDFNIVMVNSAFASALGLPDERLLARSFFAVLPNTIERSVFERVRDTGQPYQGIERAVEGTDGLTYSNIALAPIRGDDGVELLLLTLQDVTPQVRERRQVSELAEQVASRLAELDATIASIADGVVTIGVNGELLRANPAASRMFGITMADRGRPFVDCIAGVTVEDPEGRPVPPDQYPGARALRGETIVGELLSLRREKNAALWVAVSAAPIVTPRGKALGAALTFTDVTPLRRLQEQQDDLVRAISHDLRSPLTVILGHGQILYQNLSRGRLNLRRRHSAEAIVLAARQMNAMIRDLVDSARMESGDLVLTMMQVDLPKLLLRTKEFLAGIMDVDRITISAAADIPSVRADPDRLERVLINVLTNALKYSDPDAEVTVRVARAGDYVLTSVQDRGEGIAPDELPFLFQRYGRTRRSRRRRDSLGLGLYITKGLVEAHEGRIWVESEPGEGTTVYFTIPIATT